MARQVQLPLGDGSYNDDTLPYDQQECINFIPEGAETPNARNRQILRGAPGLTTLGTLAATARGAANVEGQLFAVAGTTLYSIAGDYTATALGTIAGTGRVVMDHNQIAGGYELAIYAGSNGYVYNTVTQTLTQITATGFEGGIAIGYIDSYIVGLNPLGQYFFNSALADALTYNAADRYQAESSPDAIVGMLVSHREVWLFGARTTEIWVDAGTTPITFQRQSGTVIEQGCGARYSPAKIDNSVIWLGNDGIVYRADGYLPVRISTPAVEQDISQSSWTDAFSMVWSDRGHKIYYLTFTDGKTWGYDAATGKWHRRVSAGLNRWRVSHLVRWNNTWVAFDGFNGNFYAVDWVAYTEDTDALAATKRMPYLSQHGDRLFMQSLELVMDTGFDVLSGDESVWMRYSDDGGKTYTNYREKMLGDVHQTGKRLRFTRLGSFRNRVIEITISSPVRRDLIAAYAQIKGSA